MERIFHSFFVSYQFDYHWSKLESSFWWQSYLNHLHLSSKMKIRIFIIPSPNLGKNQTDRQIVSSSSVFDFDRFKFFSCGKRKRNKLLETTWTFLAKQKMKVKSVSGETRQFDYWPRHDKSKEKKTFNTNLVKRTSIQ